MAESVRYLDSRGTALDLSTDARYLRGEGVDTWHIEPVFDHLAGDPDQLSGYTLDWTELRLSFAVSASTYANARGTVATWRKFFMNEASRHADASDTQSMGTLEIVHGGGTYTTAAAPMTPTVSLDGAYAGVALGFRTPSPLWNYGAVQTVGTAFGTASGSAAWDNTGDWKSYPTHVLTGTFDTPRFTNSVTGDYVELGTATANADDQLWVWSNPPLVRYYENGTSAGDKTLGTNWTHYAGTVSRFDPLQVGDGTLTLTTTSGTATYELRYDILKAGLG